MLTLYMTPCRITYPNDTRLFRRERGWGMHEIKQIDHQMGVTLLTIFGWKWDVCWNECIRISIHKSGARKTGSQSAKKHPSGFIEPPDVAVYELDAHTIRAFLVVELRGNAPQWAYSEDEDLACSEGVEPLPYINTKLVLVGNSHLQNGTQP